MKKFTMISALLCALFAVSTVATSCATRIENPSAMHSVTNESYGMLGELKATLGCTLMEADKAVRAAARNNNLIQLSRNNSPKGIAYEFKDISENRIDVKIIVVNEKTCDFSLKFGKTGDREFSRAFLSMVDYEMNRMGR